MSDIATRNRVNDQATVLIIADNADFARTITARWQAERVLPGFSLMSGDLCPGVNASAFDMAIVGRYMLEMRHTLKDALTAMLGNSELALAEPGALSAKSRDQLETIRHMAIRMHEILQRFSSLETELRYVEKQAEREARARSHGAADCL